VAVRKFQKTTAQQAVVGLLTIGFSTTIWAVDPPNAAQGLESLPPMTTPQMGEIAPVVVAPEPKARPAMEGPSVRVEKFNFSGNTVMTSEALSALVKDYEGRDLSMDELLEATEIVQSTYRSNGYFLAQALLPSQKLTDGVIQIKIVEGRVGVAKATVQPGASIAQTKVDGFMSLLPPGELITERSVERPLLLLSDLPGVSINSVLKPGVEFGTADVVVDVNNKGNPVSGSVFLDNQSSKFTGQYRAGVNLEANGVMGWGETFSLTGLGSFAGTDPAGESKAVRVGMVLPVGHLGTKLAVGYTAFDYEVGGPFKTTAPIGTARVTSVLMQHPYIRSRNATHFFHAGFDMKEVDDKLGGGATTLARRELNVFSIGLNGDFRDNRGGGGLNSYNVRATFGDNSIKTASALAADQSATTGLKTQGSFSKVRADYLRLQKLNFASAGHALMLSLRGQFAGNNLDGSEKMSLGGPNGVRAYSVGAASADDALLSTVEYRYTVPARTFLGGSLTLSAFWDQGTARIAHSQPSSLTATNTYSLSGIGFGLNLLKRNDFQIRLDVANRVGSTRYQGDASDGDTRAWFSLQKWF